MVLFSSRTNWLAQMVLMSSLYMCAVIGAGDQPAAAELTDAGTRLVSVEWPTIPGYHFKMIAHYYGVYATVRRPKEEQGIVPDKLPLKLLFKVQMDPREGSVSYVDVDMYNDPNPPLRKKEPYEIMIAILEVKGFPKSSIQEVRERVWDKGAGQEDGPVPQTARIISTCRSGARYRKGGKQSKEDTLHRILLVRPYTRRWEYIAGPRSARNRYYMIVVEVAKWCERSIHQFSLRGIKGGAAITALLVSKEGRPRDIAVTPGPGKVKKIRPGRKSIYVEELHDAKRRRKNNPEGLRTAGHGLEAGPSSEKVGVPEQAVKKKEVDWHDSNRWTGNDWERAIWNPEEDDHHEKQGKIHGPTQETSELEADDFPRRKKEMYRVIFGQEIDDEDDDETESDKDTRLGTT